MAANQQILKEYLLSLGFKIDTSSAGKFDAALGKFDFRVGGLAKGVLGVATAAQAMVAVFANSMEKLYYSSKKAETSAGNLRATAYGASQIGISADAMRSSVEGMARALRLNPGLQALLHDLGVPVEGRGRDDVLIDMVKQLKGMPFYAAQQYASLFGIDPDTLLLLQQQVEELEKARDLRKQMAAEVGLDETAATEAGKEYAKMMREVTERVMILRDTLALALLPLFKTAAAEINDLFRGATKTIADANAGKYGGWAGVAQRATDNFVGWVDKMWFHPEAAKTRKPKASGAADAAPPPAPSGAQLPLGLRNNNPGNLRRWQGAETSGGFAKFATPEEGLSAMAANLAAYARKGFNTVEAIINRWAPPQENDTGAYVKAVAARLKVGAGDKLDMTDPAVIEALMDAIVKHENGYNPFSSQQLGKAAGRPATTIQQTTNITVVSSDPNTAGRSVAREQERVNAGLVRNHAGAIDTP